MKRELLLLVLVAATACASGPPPPAAVDTGHDACRNCRMVVSDVHFAAQIVAAGEEPLFFDDLGCLRDYLRQQALPPGGVVYVADHGTGAWIPAQSAVYTRLARGTTPMNGGMIAHADDASRQADPGASDGTTVPASAVVPAPGGAR